MREHGAGRTARASFEPLLSAVTDAVRSAAQDTTGTEAEPGVRQAMQESSAGLFQPRGKCPCRVKVGGIGPALVDAAAQVLREAVVHEAPAHKFINNVESFGGQGCLQTLMRLQIAGACRRKHEAPAAASRCKGTHQCEQADVMLPIVDAGAEAHQVIPVQVFFGYFRWVPDLCVKFIRHDLRHLQGVAMVRGATDDQRLDHEHTSHIIGPPRGEQMSGGGSGIRTRDSNYSE